MKLLNKFLAKLPRRKGVVANSHTNNSIFDASKKHVWRHYPGSIRYRLQKTA